MKKLFFALLLLISGAAFASAANLDTIQNSAGNPDIVTIEVTNASHYVTTGGIRGTLSNSGSVTCYIRTNTATAPVADGAQHIGEIALPAGGTIELPRGCTVFTHITSSSTTTLVFVPIRQP